jgi:hypothetical protein
MRVTNRVYAAVAAAVVLTASGHARAQSLADRETARSLMDEGDKKRDAGDTKGALKNYEAADAIMHVPTTGLEVARAHVALGQLLEAREALGRVLRLPAKPGEPAPFTAARKAADTLNNELASRIPSIVVVVANADATQQPQISIDGETIPAAAASVPRKVNPGAHTVLVKVGSFEKKLDVAVVERENKTVNVDAKDQPPPPPKETTPEEPGRKTGGGSTGKVLMFSGFGVAVIGIGVGTVTGLMSLSKTNELKEVCPNDQCPPGKQGEIDSATSLGNISTAAFVVGGLGLGVGIVGLLVSSGGEKEPPASAAHVRRPASAFAPERVRAVLGPSYVGVSGVF